MAVSHSNSSSNLVPRVLSYSSTGGRVGENSGNKVALPHDSSIELDLLLWWVLFLRVWNVNSSPKCFSLNESKDAFHLTELIGQTGHLERLTPQRLQINTLRGGWYILLQKNARGYHASVPSNCCIFFAKTDGSGRSVMAKGNRPKLDGLVSLGRRFYFFIISWWSGGVIRRTGETYFNAVSHNRARPWMLFSNSTWQRRG